MKRLPWISLLITLSWVILFYGFLNDLGPEEKRRTLLWLGAKARAPVLDGGETWRLLSSAFLHHGTFHLWSNCAGVLVIGMFLEKQVSRLSLLSLTFVATVIAMGDDLLLHEGVTVGGSVVVFAWAGSVFGYSYKEKKVMANLPILLALASYLSVTLWIGSQVVHIAHRTHLIALCLGFVLGLKLTNDADTHRKPFLAFFALILSIGLLLGQNSLGQYRELNQKITVANAGLTLAVPIFWDVKTDNDVVMITNATDVMLWANCVTDQKPPVLENVIRQFLTDQLYLPQVFSVAEDIKFKPARSFMAKSGRPLEGYQVPFSFLGQQGHYDGLYHVWIFGLTRCSLVSTSWRYLDSSSEYLLGRVLESIHIETVLPQITEEDFDSLFLATQQAYALGEFDSYQKWITFLEEMPSPNKGKYYLMRAKEALVLQKNAQKGLEWAFKALDTLPKDREVVLLVAGLLLQDGQVKRARQVLMHANLLTGKFEDWLDKTRWLVP